MKQENKQELYASPEVEVIEVKASQLMCASGDYPGLTNDDDDDYGF